MESGLKLWGLMTASAIVLSNDSPTLVKAAARLAKVVFGDRIQICDGVNDHVEIQAALDAAGAPILLKGTYYIESSLVLDSYQTLRGCGRSTILTTTTANLDIITATGGSGTEKVGILITELCIDGATWANDNGIQFTYVDHSKITSVWIVDTGENAIHLDYCDFDEVVGNILINIYGTGIYLRGTDDIIANNYQSISCTGLELQSCSRCVVEGDVFYDCDSYGIYAYGSHNNAITGNTIFDVCEAMYLEDSDENSISGNTLHQVGEGIDLLNGLANSVIGNTIAHAVGSGILIDCAHRTTITGNTVQNSGEYGIYIAFATYVIVSGNACHENGEHGIYLSQAHHCTIVGNECLSNSQATTNTSDGIRFSAADDNLISNNVCRQGALANKPKYGINISNATCDRNLVIGNNLHDSGATAPINDAGTNTTFDLSVHSEILDLSGGATDLVTFFAECPCQLVGYSILYTEASSADAGVAIRVGRYQDGVALDDDYFDISTSEVSKNMGYAKHFATGDLTQVLLAAGDTVTIGTAGGKGDGGEVMLILQIAKMAS